MNDKKNVVLFIFTFLVILTLSGCGNNSSDISKETLPITENYFIFDTVVSVKVYDERMNDTHFDNIKNIMEHIDVTMNRFQEQSEVTRINELAGVSPVKVSEETFHIIKTAKDYAVRSGGKFDPTIGPLVDLWAIGNGGSTVPDNEAINRAKQLVGFDKLMLDEKNFSVQLLEKGMTLDLGAIAKGYAADVIADYLQKEDFSSAIIDLGGNIIAMGSKPGKDAWSIGIQSPEENRGAYLGTISVKDKTIVTSGIYERYFIYENKQYHHVLDPFTGYPVNNDLVSATIITDQSMHADAMSTTVFSLGLEEGINFIEEIENTEAIFVTHDKKVYVTSGLKTEFKLTTEEYTMAE